jgi:transcriptional regulator of heat shock response
MVRTVDYETRRRAVLAAAINRYIDDAVPVASEAIAEDFKVSSATIRNIFSELEEAGLLTHSHTSGGRIPKGRGYRYYVDLLISQMELLSDEKERIVKEYRKELRRLEEALEKTSEVLAAITHYASIVSILEWQDRMYYKGISGIVSQPEFHDIEKVRLLIRLIEDKEKLLDIINREFSGKVKVYIGSELGCPGMENCSLIVSSYRLNDKPLGRLAVLGPMRMQYSHTIPTLEYISEVLSEVLDGISRRS